MCLNKFWTVAKKSFTILSSKISRYQLVEGNGVFSVLRFGIMGQSPLMGDVLRHNRFCPEPTHGLATAHFCFWAPK